MRLVFFMICVYLKYLCGVMNTWRENDIEGMEGIMIFKWLDSLISLSMFQNL